MNTGKIAKLERTVAAQDRTITVLADSVEKGFAQTSDLSVMVRMSGLEQIVALRTRELATPNPMIGVAPGVSFSSGRQQVGPSDTMFLFSDGVYEITRTDGRLIGFDEFVATLDAPALDASVRFARDARGKDALDDDFSLVRVRFG